MFIDTHAHLTDKAFDEDREEVVKKAGELGITKIITSGFDLVSSIEAVEFAKNHEGVYVSIGVYPENIGDYDEKIENELFNLANNEKVVAIGEIGLQYTEGSPDRNLQKEVFLRQIKFANKLSKPIIIHCRDAYGDLVNLLKTNKNLNYRGTIHCFSGSYEIAKELLDLGFYISVGGVSTFKNAEKLKETISKIPIERIVLETDCPYLTPHPYRGQKNSPCFIPTIAQNLAEIKGMDVEDVARITTLNTEKLFKI